MSDITRRVFHKGVTSAIGAAVVYGGVRIKLADASSFDQPLNSYNYHLRFFRKSRRVMIWARVIDLDHLEKSIPFRINLCRHQDGSDLIDYQHVVSRPDALNVTRTTFLLNKNSFAPRSSLYVQLQMDQNGISSKACKMSR